MINREEKIQRLIDICKKYYELNYTQSQIAKEYNISRPMVSKLLTEAKNIGIVKITINENINHKEILDVNLKNKYHLKNIHIIQKCNKDEETDEKIIKKAYEVINNLLSSAENIGIGWGSMIGKLINYYDENNIQNHFYGDVYPLIGSIMASYRSYHTNELVRIFATRNNINAHYIYAPAIVENEENKSLYIKSEIFNKISKGWSKLDLAIINISNYPSSPDAGTAVRFGNKLLKEGACGHFLSHFYNINGRFIIPENDYAINISLNNLRKSKIVIGICASNVSAKSIIGALNTGIITDLIISDDLCSKII